MGIFGTLGGVLGTPFGFVMWGIFQVIQNYGLALLVFTILTRLVLSPIMLKSQKSMGKMAAIQPQMQEIQKKYANNRQKQNEEMSELYKRVGYNPMSGCLPMALQMFLLFGVIDVIFRPLTHILRLESSIIQAANEITLSLGEFTARGVNAVELSTLGAVADYPARFYSALPYDAVASMQGFIPQMHFLGINFMETPSMDMLSQIFTNFNPVLFIPILSGLTALLLSFNMPNQSQQMAGGAHTKIMMLLMMPAMSVWIAFTMPAGVGIYWIFSNVVTVVQQRIMNKIYNPKEEAEKARKEMEEARERERLERVEAKKKRKESGAAEVDIESLSKKDQNRLKLAEARRRDAEKYGEEYVEPADD